MLRAAGEPLHTKEITKRVLESGRSSGLKGKTPEATVTAMPAVGSKPGGSFKLGDKATRLLIEDPECARRLLELMPRVPTPVWGRDELRTGELWNSNSLISWLIARTGLDVDSIRPPAGGRAPGWQAGIVVAHRQQAQAPADDKSQRRGSTSLTEGVL